MYAQVNFGKNLEENRPWVYFYIGDEIADVTSTFASTAEKISSPEKCRIWIMEQLQPEHDK